MPGRGSKCETRPPRVGARQPESALSAGIDPVWTAVFNPGQVPRLLQEFRVLAKQSDERTRQDLEEAAVFIESEIAAIGAGSECHVVFLGD